MKPHILFGLTLSLMTFGAFAAPASEHQGFSSSALSVVENCNNLAQRYQRVADNGPDRLVQQYQRVS